MLLSPFGLSPPIDLPELERLDADDWQTLVRAASLHRVLPALFASPIGQHAPPPWREELQAAYFSALTFHLETIDAIETIAPVLRDVEVRWAVVKGPILSELCYPRPDLRPYGDLDVLVHPGDFRRAVEALELMDGRVLERNWTAMADAERGELAVVMPSGPVIDVHWHLLIDGRDRRALRLDTARILERSHHARLGRTDVPALDPLDQLVHLFVHAGLSGGHYLQWSLDLWFAEQALAPWAGEQQERLDARLQETGATLIAKVMSDRAERLLNRTLPAAPAKKGAGRWWASGLRKLDTLRPPENWNGGPGSGRLLLASTRSSTLSSTNHLFTSAALAVREVTTNTDHPWRRHRRSATPPTPELMLEDHDIDGRDRYFRQVAATAARDG